MVRESLDIWDVYCIKCKTKLKFELSSSRCGVFGYYYCVVCRFHILAKDVHRESGNRLLVYRKDHSINEKSE